MMKFIPWTNIKLTGGFWKGRQEIAAKNTSRAIYGRFYDTGRIEAMKLQWKEGMPNKPHVFWDSDIAKWMEGTAYLLYLQPDAELSEKLDTMIGYIEKGQAADGYFNSAILTLEPQKRFTDRTNHELYTAGHFIEAAVAHYYSTGSGRFLKLMCRFADCVERIFLIEQSAPYQTPGHQELELALVRLYHATGEKRYLELSKHFVDTRGQNAGERVFSVPNGTYPACPPLQNQLLYNDTYAQDDAPARELPAAGGHAVRAMYFYTAMADLSIEYEDSSLFEACKRLWEDCVFKKMYVTGGVSAERYGEAIGAAYVLPNDYAYAETCASVAMANFSQRMFCLEQDGRYADMIELQMYNGALAGLSIDGKGFYYDNALLSRPAVNNFFHGINAKPFLPAYQRQEIFECSCCPPNIYRFIGAVGQYFYSTATSAAYIHQFAQSSATLTIGGQNVTFQQDTNYPWEGKVAITLTVENPAEFIVAVRIPGWCENAVVTQNGMAVPNARMKQNYLYMDAKWKSGDVILIDLPMEVVQLEGNPKIVDTSGKVALRRGPVIYCLEGTDNPYNLFGLTLTAETRFTEKTMVVNDAEFVALCGNGLVQKESVWKNALYLPIQQELETAEFTAVPYFAWANRAIGDMTVWIKRQI